jgi:hypothetical protein
MNNPIADLKLVMDTQTVTVLTEECTKAKRNSFQARMIHNNAVETGATRGRPSRLLKKSSSDSF